MREDRMEKPGKLNGATVGGKRHNSRRRSRRVWAG